MTSIIRKKRVEAVDSSVVTPHASCAKPVKGILAAAVLPLALTGCEAPLNLEGVDKEQAKSVRRTDQFQAVAANDSTVLAVGSDGIVLTSPRNNISWTRQLIESQPSLVDVESCPDQSFAALGMDGQVWFADAKGENWTPSPIGTQENVLSLACGPDNSVWVTASFSTIINSKDKGASWSEITLEEDSQLTDVKFIDENTLVIAGEFGLVVKSTDGGDTWSAPEYMPNDFYPQGIHFANANEGWAAGLSGQILHTTDGGLSWQQQTTPTESPLYSFHALGDRLFVMGDHGNVLELNGQGWKRIDAPKIPVYLRDAEALSDKQLLVAGGWGSLFTVDVQ